jgi:polyphosphate kinase 2 (PPK2 family)
MKTSEVVEAAKRFSKPYRVTNGRFRLTDVDPRDTGELTSEDKPRAKEALQTGVQALAELQDVLYAQDRWSLLLIFQAMDAAGKDGAIKHVMSGINPQGCQVTSFKAPSSGDLDHDYLWRCIKALPERGRIGIFNRSYYEETLVVRVHPELLSGQKLPQECVTKDIWEERFQDIGSFERYLARMARSSASFSPRVEEGAAEALPRTARQPGQELEILGERREGAGFLGSIHGGL